MQKQKIQIHLPANLIFSYLVRQIASEVFSYIGFSKEWTDRLKLVVDELFMNASRYGSKENENTISITFTYDKEMVEFRIDDEGGGARISANALEKIIKKNESELGNVSKTCGRGLALISKLWTDNLRIEENDQGGISVIFEKSITTDMPPVPPALVIKPHEEMAKTSAAQSPVLPQGPTFVVELSGEIDQSNIEEKVQLIQNQITQFPSEGTLILDMKQLKYINSTFIGLLASWHNTIQQKNGHLVLRHANKQIKDILSLVGLGKVIYIES